MNLPELSEIDILAARLRTELDAALGRETPQAIREAAERYGELEEPELTERVIVEEEHEPRRAEPERDPEPAAEREPDYFKRDPFDTTRRIDPERYYAEPEGPERDIGDREPGD